MGGPVILEGRESLRAGPGGDPGVARHSKINRAGELILEMIRATGEDAARAGGQPGAGVRTDDGAHRRGSVGANAQRRPAGRAVAGSGSPKPSRTQYRSADNAHYVNSS